jgi:hypothetical protein
MVFVWHTMFCHMEIISFASGNKLFVIGKSIVFIRKSMVLHREIRGFFERKSKVFHRAHNGFSQGNQLIVIGKPIVLRMESKGCS